MNHIETTLINAAGAKRALVIEARINIRRRVPDKVVFSNPSSTKEQKRILNSPAFAEVFNKAVTTWFYDPNQLYIITQRNSRNAGLCWHLLPDKYSWKRSHQTNCWNLIVGPDKKRRRATRWGAIEVRIDMDEVERRNQSVIEKHKEKIFSTNEQLTDYSNSILYSMKQMNTLRIQLEQETKKLAELEASINVFRNTEGVPSIILV